MYSKLNNIIFTQVMDFFEGIQSSCPKTNRIILIIGLLIVIKKIYTLLNRIHILLLRKRKDLKKRYGAGSWVFITGSSEGIGRALAFSLAKEGFNIILSARTVKKLQNVQKQIQAKYRNCEVKILPADYKKSFEWSYMSNLLEEIVELDISMVINNVGMDVLDQYTDLEASKIEDLIKLNCFPMAYINRFFIPLMQKRTANKKLKCAIVNVSSIAGTIPMPYYNIYSATKAYVDKLSRSLNYEYPQIDILSLRPSEVSTPMTCNKDVDIFTITAQQCAEGLLNQIGHGDKTTYGYWRHQLQGWLYESVPQTFFNYIFKNYVAPDDMKLRKDALKKKS